MLALANHATYDYGYERNGVANIFCAVEPKRGKYITSVKEKKTGKEFAEFMRQIAKQYKNAKKIGLIADNYPTHKKKSLLDRYGKSLVKRYGIDLKFTIHLSTLVG